MLLSLLYIYKSIKEAIEECLRWPSVRCDLEKIADRHQTNSQINVSNIIDHESMSGELTFSNHWNFDEILYLNNKILVIEHSWPTRELQQAMEHYSSLKPVFSQIRQFQIWRQSLKKFVDESVMSQWMSQWYVGDNWWLVTTPWIASQCIYITYGSKKVKTWHFYTFSKEGRQYWIQDFWRKLNKRPPIKGCWVNKRLRRLFGQIR